MKWEQSDEFINQDFCALSDWLFSLNAYEFTIAATAIGLAIAPTLTVNQQNSLGNFFELIGQVLLTVNAQKTTLQQANVKKSSIKPYFETSNLEDEILKIKREVINLRNDSLSNNK